MTWRAEAYLGIETVDEDGAEAQLRVQSSLGREAGQNVAELLNDRQLDPDTELIVKLQDRFQTRRLLKRHGTQVGREATRSHLRATISLRQPCV